MKANRVHSWGKLQRLTPNVFFPLEDGADVISRNQRAVEAIGAIGKPLANEKHVSPLAIC